METVLDQQFFEIKEEKIMVQKYSNGKVKIYIHHVLHTVDNQIIYTIISRFGKVT